MSNVILTVAVVACTEFLSLTLATITALSISLCLLDSRGLLSTPLYRRSDAPGHHGSWLSLVAPNAPPIGRGARWVRTHPPK